MIARLYYWDDPHTDEAARVEESAQVVCEHLNRWWVGMEPGSQLPDAPERVNRGGEIAS